MIVDTIPLSGKNAYLLSDNDEINLGGTAPQIGRTPPIGPGIMWDVSSLELQIEGDDLLSLFSRQAGPILSLSVIKEMFPDLYDDPFSRRVHTISGYDDFSKGFLEDFRVMDVDGIPTLVSTGTEMSRWLSSRYHFSTAFDLHSAAWELATSKLTPAEGFEYGVILHIWHDGDDLGNPATTHVTLADQATPLSNRLWQPVDGQHEATNILAYQLEFTAVVHYDTYLKERRIGVDGTESLGQPLLRAINLLERTEPVHDFYSLQELVIASLSYRLFEKVNGSPQRIITSFGLGATLREGESIALSVYSPDFTNVEARLIADIQTRSPETNTG